MHTRERGFTTQEPWIPLVIVIVLAMVAFVTLKRIGRESRLRVAVQHTLFTLSVSEREYHARHHTYSDTLTVLPDSNVIITITHADSAGWTAEGMHPFLGRGTKKCYIYGGRVAHDQRIARPDEPVCW